MNCADCRDNFIASVEGLLDRDQSLQCQAHLQSCAACRAEYEALAGLQRRLMARGQTAAGVRIVEPVMRRIHAEQFQPERESLMSKILKHRWGFGLGAAAGAAAILAIILMAMPNAQAQALAVMTKGAQAVAKLTSIHLRGQVRTLPADNFSLIMPDQDFVTIELWKQFEPDFKWRVEKPGRVAVMDGRSTLLFIKPDFGYKVPSATPSAFDTQWLHEMANLNKALETELAAIKSRNWPITLTQGQGADGKAKSVVTVEAKSAVGADDYLHNKFFSTADTRRVYTFDNQSELLESVQIYLHAPAGDQLVFKLDEIDCNQPIDPSVFQLQLPANVSIGGAMPMLPDNEKYAALTSEQAARALFEACAREDWTEAAKFFNPLSDTMKQYLGGLQVVSLGTHTNLSNGAEIVPYEITLKNGEAKKWNLGLKRDPTTRRWFVDGGI
ncbi:MAG TPA: zf-HC2 domain-containing protein [Candidatus Acidoferrum sp.]|nr:zf-HC2 domain-containing protein [Candidatus Acidoferrum sp.]